MTSVPTNTEAKKSRVQKLLNGKLHQYLAEQLLNETAFAIEIHNSRTDVDFFSIITNSRHVCMETTVEASDALKAKLSEFAKASGANLYWNNTRHLFWMQPCE